MTNDDKKKTRGTGWVHSDAIADSQPCPVCGGTLLQGSLSIRVRGGQGGTGELEFRWNRAEGETREKLPVVVLSDGSSQPTLRCRTCRSLLIRSSFRGPRNPRRKKTKKKTS